MILGTSGFEIADKKDLNGDWIFRTFGTGKGFTADEIVAGILTSILIQNVDGSFKIDLSQSGGCSFYNNNKLALKIYNNLMEFYNWGKSGNYIGSIGSTTANGSQDGTPYIEMWHNPSLSAISIGYRDTDGFISPYVRFDKNKLGNSNYPIEFSQPIGFNKEIDMQSCYFYIDKKNLPNAWLHGSTSGGIYCGSNFAAAGDLECNGDKKCIQHTDKFGDIKFSSVEDVGAYLTWREYDAFKEECIYETKMSKYNKDGYYSCIVEIPQIIQECIDTTGQYDVDINVIKSFANARLWTINKKYFLVKSDKPCRFNFVLTGRRKGFEARSIEEQLIEAEKYKVNKTKEENDLLIKKAKFKLLGVKRDFRLWEQCGNEWLNYRECFEG